MEPWTKSGVKPLVMQKASGSYLVSLHGTKGFKRIIFLGSKQKKRICRLRGNGTPGCGEMPLMQFGAINTGNKLDKLIY
jgi:hypothetical protein